MQSLIDRCERLRRCFVRTTEDFDSLAFEIRKRKIQPAGDERLIHGHVGRQVNVRGTIVTVDAIHSSSLGGGHLLRTGRPISIGIFGDVTLAVLHSNPWNYLAMIVRGNEGDLVTSVHVPVDARNCSGRGVAASYIHQHANRARRVLLVIGIVSKTPELIAVELRGPVTQFAGVAGRPHVMYRCSDWPGRL